MNDFFNALIMLLGAIILALYGNRTDIDTTQIGIKGQSVDVLPEPIGVMGISIDLKLWQVGLDPSEHRTTGHQTDLIMLGAAVTVIQAVLLRELWPFACC